MKKGDGVTHPTTCGKDLYDAESVAIWLAATYACQGLEIVW